MTTSSLSDNETLHAFVRKVVISGCAILLDTQPTGVPIASLSPAPYVPDGVAVDWSALHAALKVNAALHEREIATLRDAVSAQTSPLVTSIELLEPWEKFPLVADASRLCNFALDDKWYRFKRGPPGQRSIMESVSAMLASVCEQLRAQSVMAYPIMGGIIIVSSSFDEALHRTAQVHKILKSNGFNIFGSGSCFVPRAVKFDSCHGRTTWSTIDVDALGEHIAEFFSFAYRMLLHDSYLYGGQPYGFAMVDGRRTTVDVPSYISQAMSRRDASPEGMTAIQDAVENLLKLAGPSVAASQKFSYFEARWFNCEIGFACQ